MFRRLPLNCLVNLNTNYDPNVNKEEDKSETVGHIENINRHRQLSFLLRQISPATEQWTLLEIEGEMLNIEWSLKILLNQSFP